MKKAINIILSIVIFLPLTVHSQITIKGDVAHIPAKQIYLIDAYSHEKIDSAVYKNNKFILFFNNKNGDIEPKLVSIIYFNKRAQVLSFKNPYGKISPTSFMLEDGVTLINGNIISVVNNTTNRLDISPGYQSKAYFNNITIDFGVLRSKDQAQRKKAIASYLSAIKAYPNSYYLMSEIHESRQMFTSQELLAVANAFDLRLRSSQQGQELFKSIKSISGLTNMNKLLCKNINGEIVDVLHDQSKPKILIFWASWCTPCREEIPYLKKLFSKYSGKIQFAIISMDVNKRLWEIALGQEKMNWPQFINNKDRDELKDNFRFNSIPLILIVKHHKIIKRFDGFNTNEFAAIGISLNSIRE
jgi:thiol-disulfide isomerase/thioredoxin